MSTKSIALGTATVLIALLADNVAAGAKGSHHGSNNSSMKMHFEHSEHSFHHQPHLRFVVRSNYDCSYYYERWLDTGSRYWKHKYFDCRD